MTARLVCIPPDKVALVWPHVRDLILAAMKRGDLSSFRPVEASVLCGDALLWLAMAGDEYRGADPRHRGACRERPVGHGEQVAATAVTVLQQTEWRKVCIIVACAGAEMHRWLRLLDGIETYARAEGCSAIRIMGRKGWARVLTSYRAKQIILEKDL
jgi:hypothetical protein